MRLIDADALMKKYGEPCHSFADVIENMPTIEAEPVRHGKWIQLEGNAITNEFFCSECGQRKISFRVINPKPGGFAIADEKGRFYYPPDDKYCNECGAKMDLK